MMTTPIINLPKFVVVELTYQCNHRCLFCYCPWEYENKYREQELTKEEWFEVFDRLASLGVNHITLTGGEPLLRDDLIDIIKYVHHKNFIINLISNGKMVSDELLQTISQYKVFLSISVPGIETFKDHTGIDNIENVLNIFSKAQKLKISAAANITVTKKNLLELYKNIALPLLYGANYILLNRFLPGGRGMLNKEYLLNIDEINQMLDIVEEVLSKGGFYGHIGTELPYCIIKNPQKYKHLQVSSKCSAAKNFFVIDPSGYIKVCNHSPQRLVFYKDFDKLSSNSTWNNYLTSNFLHQMCKDCPHLHKCDGGCREAAHVNYGSIDEIDPCFGSNN